MRILGIDYGKKRIGAAVSDPLGLTAQPVEVIENNASAMNRIKELCEKYEAGSVVVGLPKSLKGEVAKSAEDVLAFIAKLQKVLGGIPVIPHDERLSTSSVIKTLSQTGMSGRKKRLVVDKMAAAYILQGYMDGLQKNTD